MLIWNFKLSLRHRMDADGSQTCKPFLISNRLW